MKGPLTLALVLTALALAGCANPDAPSSSTSSKTALSLQNSGEPSAPPPPAPSTQGPTRVQSTASAAISSFAALYVNWSYRTLAEHQLALAAMSVGAARLAERQAAASSRDDQTIARGHIYNRGQLLSVAADRARPDWWVLVTREQTGGAAQYEGLPAGYHVTLVQLASVVGGYAVEQWLPQS